MLALEPISELLHVAELGTLLEQSFTICGRARVVRAAVHEERSERLSFLATRLLHLFLDLMIVALVQVWPIVVFVLRPRRPSFE